MIQSITINDNTKLPGAFYASRLEAFQNGKTYNFNPGINIIVGNNGCGKSTLLNVMACYTLCHRSVITQLPEVALEFPPLFDVGKGEDSLCDGAALACDYAGVVYRYMTTSEIDKSQKLCNHNVFDLYCNNRLSSTGEQMLNSLDTLFQISFKNQKVNFPILELREKAKEVNDLWSKRINLLLDYYRANAIRISEEDFQFTYLIDEPDRNLDLENIETLYGILSYQKELTQIIAVVHNPILIYKLSKLPYINFIEMTDGHLDKVKRVLENL